MKIDAKASAFLAVLLVMLVLIGVSAVRDAGSSQYATDTDVAHASCRNTVNELIHREGGGVTIHHMDDIVVRPATWLEFAGLTREDQRAERATVSRHLVAESFLERERRSFDAEDWLNYSTTVTFERGFRSAQTGSNRVVCEIIVRASQALADNPPQDGKIFISGANLQDYLSLGLRL